MKPNTHGVVHQIGPAMRIFLKSINAKNWDHPKVALMTACHIMEKAFFDDDIGDLRRHLSEAAKRIGMQNSTLCMYAASKLLNQESMSNASVMHSPAEEVITEFLRFELSDRNDEAAFQIHALICIASNLELLNIDDMIALFSCVAKKHNISNKSWFAPLLYSMEKRQQHAIAQVA